MSLGILSQLTIPVPKLFDHFPQQSGLLLRPLPDEHGPSSLLEAKERAVPDRPELVLVQVEARCFAGNLKQTMTTVRDEACAFAVRD